MGCHTPKEGLRGAHVAHASGNRLFGPSLRHVSREDEEEQEFQAAMGIWNSHRYADGAKLLREFAEKHPNSWWAEEAKLHCGCNLYYEKR
ncbi:MAG: hypothetical protein QHH26_13180 [Armatimonadota bacterium]|nr:hypothetical protein [Armatimonadota bacterium]